MQTTLVFQLCLAALILFFTRFGHADVDPLELFPNGRHADLLQVEHLEVMHTSADVTFDNILSYQAGKKWQAPTSNSINSVAVDQHIWVRFNVVNYSQRKGDFIAELRWPLIEHVVIAKREGDEFGDKIEAGLDVPLAASQLKDKNVSFAFELEAGESAWIYLLYPKQRFVFSPVMIWPEQEYHIHTNNVLIFFSVIAGMMLVMSIYNCSLFIFTQDRTYLFYVNVVLSLLIYLLAVSGYGRLYVWGESEWFKESGHVLFTVWSFLSATYFFRWFLKLWHYKNWLLYGNNILLVCWSIALVMSVTPFRGLSFASTAPLGIATILAGLVGSIYLWLKGDRQAKYFVISWSGVWYSTFIVICVMFGAISYAPYTDFLQPGSFTLEVILLSMALADRINSQRKEKETAQQLALSRQLEMIEMQEQANNELEENVRKRTLELAAVAADLERANEELAAANRLDGLTQIYNRAHFDYMVKNEMCRSSRNGSPLSMLLIDIDHFKSINDNYGHLVGDKCLKLVASTISNTVTRATDLVARYGGEEFAAILPDTPESAARDIAERVRKSVEGLAFISEGEKIPLTVSVGYAGRAMPQGMSPDRLIKAADQALYVAKEKGRNRVEIGRIAS